MKLPRKSYGVPIRFHEPIGQKNFGCSIPGFSGARLLRPSGTGLRVSGLGRALRRTL